MSKTSLFHPICLLTFLAVVLQVQGYSIEGNQIVIERKDDWLQWTYPQDVVEIAEDGEIRPAFVRKDINACLNATQFGHKERFRGGIRAAGSNAEGGLSMMDGDLHTHWEPDHQDTLSNWWIQLDMGRLVSATRVVVRFVEEGEGDPFLGFKVFVSRGDTDPWKKDVLNWTRVGMVEDTEERRMFEFELAPFLHVERLLEGDLVQYVWLLVTHTKGERAEEITEEEYEELDPDLQGAIDHYKRISSTEERYIRRETYYELPPEERGSIRYYRREVPRLAEVEVWSIGDNISLGILDRGGSIRVATGLADVKGVDGSYLTRFVLPNTQSPSGKEGVTLDLGATFWVDTIQLVNRSTGSFGGRESLEKTYPDLAALQVKASDGSLAANGEMGWIVLMTSDFSYRGDVRPSDISTWIRVWHSKPRKLRFLNVQNWDGRFHNKDLHELQMYGEGYVPGVMMASPFIPVEGGRLGSIQWDGDTTPGAELVIRTRTGNELTPVERVRYFDTGGNEITEQRYNDLPGFMRGEIRRETQMVPEEDWSPWSDPYGQSGASVSSPSPRKYLQIQIEFLSDDPDAYASIRSLWVDLLHPLVQQVVSEISPVHIPRPGVPYEFSLFLHPVFSSYDLGFDEILIRPSLSTRLTLLGVRMGSESEFLADSATVLSPEQVEVLSSSEDSLYIRLPGVIGPGDADLVEVRLEGVVYLTGTTFYSWVAHSSHPESAQRIEEGDATELVDTGTLRVHLPDSRKIIGDLEVYPKAFTPNGDGINDEVEIGFSVYEIGSGKDARVEIYDLGGRRIWGKREWRDPAGGRYSVLWDGKDEESHQVVPGIYIVLVRVDAESENAEDEVKQTTVYVLY